MNDDFDRPEKAPWWFVTPAGIAGKMALIAAGVALVMIAASEWLEAEWQRTPTRYPDGRVVEGRR